MHLKYPWGILSLFVCTLWLLSSCGNTSSEQSNQNPALEEFNTLIKKNPSDPDLYFNRAKYFLGKESFKNAISDFEKARKLDSLNAKYYIDLSDAYLFDLQSKKAVNTLEKFTGLSPGNIPVLLKLTKLHYTLQQYDLGILTVNEVFKVDLQNAEATFLLGALLRAQGKTEAAVNALQSAVELDPEIIDAWILLGDLYDAAADPDALIYFNNALSIDPNNVQAIHSKAFYLQKNIQKKVDNESIMEAIQLYKSIHKIDSTYSDAYLNAGILYLEVDSIPAAYQEFDQLIQQYPNYHLAYYYRGISNELLNKSDQAIEDYEYSLKMSPNFQKAKDAIKALTKE